MKPQMVVGDLLDQPVEVIVNSWNRNIIPWWLLLPQGVSAAIKKRGGTQPFQQLARLGPIPLGEARLTTAGRLPFKGIVHVAGINLFWFATEYSVTQSVRNAMREVERNGFRSVAFPLIGSGSGNRARDWSRACMLRAFDGLESDAEVLIVEYRPQRA
ncbi:macro domain-containing protein [Pseudomarimonas arenosa]|uniref:Macro domain-containing protein n=1 Tax=Pseudomarimonas arenosa TaxID=2774145 RepID=A0AAW3ZKZ8_9GAMM|nr:macro domain-containing protein [Pseudomarimonas arenosa]MBD8526403.1 macro domain-containing protein [Pseudomarimonas arenosa]